MSNLILTVSILTAAIVIYAIAAGGKPERYGAIIVSIWYLADPIYQQFIAPSQFQTVDTGQVTMDSLDFLAMLVLAFLANRVWPLFAVAGQMIVLVGHLAPFLTDFAMQRAYWALTQLPLFIQLAALLLGTIMHRRRVQRIGPYRDWRTQPA